MSLKNCNSHESADVNLVYSLVGCPAGGTFRLAYRGHQSEELPYDASTEMANAAFEHLWRLSRPDEESALDTSIPQVVADEVSDAAWLEAVETMIYHVKTRMRRL